MIVTALVLAPILIGFLVYALPERAARPVGIVVTALALLAVLADPHAPDANITWLQRPFAAAFHLGYGPVSYWLVLLLTVVAFSAVLATRIVREREFIAQILLLLGAMAGVFLAKDLLLFALFWDLMLIPVFLVMLGWGHPARTGARYGTAAWRYLVYNLVGGLALLLATAAYGILQGTTDVIGAAVPPAAPASAYAGWVMAGFAFAFLIKTPVWPLHTWMPDTYAELPPPVVALVSAVQSKAGLYGFLAIGLPLLGAQMHAFAPVFVVLGVIAMLYGAFVALAQRDVKRVVAYSSLSHLGLILIAIAVGEPLALQGAVVYLVAHGFFSAALFLALGFIEEREETRDLGRLGGLGWNNPRLAGGLMLAALAALGLPGLAGFTGEILIITGIFRAGQTLVAVIALVPIVLASAYMLRLYQGAMNGPLVDDLPERRDLTWVEGLALAPLVAGFVWLGVNPSSVVALAASLGQGVTK